MQRSQVTLPSQDEPAALASEIAFIVKFKETLLEEIARDRDYGGLLTALSGHFDDLEKAVRRADSTGKWAETSLISWGRVTCSREGKSGLQIKVRGPASGDGFELVAASGSEAAQISSYVDSIDLACQRMQGIQNRCGQILKKRLELEADGACLKQLPSTTVEDHIRLLQEYNDMKDVGQHLIGLIAENRGVSIGSLYKDEDYGVGADN